MATVITVMATKKPEISGLGRLLWVFLLAGLAVLAVIVQADRQARKTSWLAYWVPSPFRGFAAEVLVRDEITTGDGTAAVRDATRLLARRPIPSSHLSYLAQAEIHDGNQSLGAQAIYLAAGREWRDALAQQAVAEAALANDELEIAGQRLYALWVITEGNRDDDPRLRELTQVILTKTTAQIAFGRELGQAGSWKQAFFTWGRGGLPRQAFVTVIATAQRAHASFGCGALGDYARALYLAGEASMAASIWQGPCSAGRAAAEGDFRFHPIEGSISSGPFDWVYSDADMIGLQFQLSDNGHEIWLQFENGDPIRRIVAFRFTRLQAGQHVAMFNAVIGNRMQPAIANRFVMQIDCVSGDGRMQRAASILPSTRQINFSVPEGCPVQRVALIAQHSAGQVKAAYVR